MAQQGSLELLNDPVAKALLGSANPARLAYTWMDGSPRVVPIWFHWTGDQLVLGSPPKAPKLRALAADPRAAVTIDGNEWPHKVLLVRGRASVEMLDDVSPEYERAAARYFGPEQRKDAEQVAEYLAYLFQSEGLRFKLNEIGRRGLGL